MEKNKNISYINNAFSEYIGSNIFNIVGFKTQNTILGRIECITDIRKKFYKTIIEQRYDIIKKAYEQ